MDDTNNAKFRLSAADLSGNSNFIISSTFTVDSTPPSISLQNPPTWLQGGNTYNINYSASDHNGLSTFILEYAEDGTNYTTLTTTNAPPFAWSVPTVDITIAARLRLTAIDPAGNQSQTTSSLFGIDSTAPVVSLADMAAIIRGGTSNNVTLSSSDSASGVATAALSYSNDSGSTYSMVASSPSQPTYSWATPAVDLETARLRYVVTDVVGNVTTVENTAFEIDSTAPASTLDSPATRIRGGDTLSLNFTATDKNGVNTLSFEYAEDGVNYTVLSSSPTSPYSWTVPVTDTTGSKLRLVSTDSVGNQSIIETTSFEIDSTPSPVASITLNTPLYTNITATTLTMGNCTDINSVFINESTAPGRDDSGWQPCTTNVGGITYTLPAIEGEHTLKAWTKDDVGNVSLTATDITLYYDVTNPVLSFTTPPMLAGANTYTVNWDLTELYIDNTISFNVDYWNGSAWIDVEDQAVTAGPHSSQAFTASWTTPSLDREDILLRVQVVDLAGNTGSAQTMAFEIDSTPPASTLDNPPAILRGGDTLALNFTATDKNGINTLTLEYAADGTNYSTVVSSPTSPYTWNIPTDDVQTARLRLVSTDPVGNQTTVTTSSFEVDSTKPSAPLISLHTPQYTNVTGVAFTVANCNQDFNEILINTGTTPSDGDSAWVNCNTSTGGITYTLSTTEGPHALSAWVRDDAGNISATSTDFTVYYDVTNPALAVSNPGLLAGNTSYTINWTLTEAYINNTRSFNVDYWNGSTWVDIVDQAVTTGPHSTQGFSASWTTPGLDRTDIRLRVQVTDLAGNTTTAQSTTFEIDSTFPALTISSPGNNSYHKSSAVITGNCESGRNINFSGALQSDFAVACSGGTYSQTVNFSNGDGSKLIVLTQTDAAGNTTTKSITLIRDEIAPILSLNSGNNPDFTNQNQPNTWGGTCEGTYSITITGDEATTIPCSSGIWSWTPTAKTSDGIFSYSLTQTDAAGNTSAPALSLSWERDATPPLFNMSSPIAISGGQTKTDTNNLNQRTLSGSCEGSNVINITGAQTAAISCSASSWSWTTATYTSDATRNFTLTQSDSAGNTTSFTYRWIRDTTGPQLTLNTNTLKTNTNTTVFSGDCEAGLDISISGVETNTVSCPSGTWSYTTNTRTGDATRNFTFTQTFTVSPFNSTSVSGTWIRETNPPTISSFTTTANDPSTNAYIPIDLQATSQNSNVYISEICFTRLVTTAPAANDECWLGVDSPSVGLPLGQTLTLNDFFILLGWTTRTYDMYPWVKDEAGNISSLSNSGNGTISTDKILHGYDPGIAPTVSDVTASNVNNPQVPPTRTQSSVPAGQDVYIRWKVTDNTTMPSGSVSLFYTTDDTNYTAISTAQSLNPHSDTGCGVSLGANEGCYLWPGGSPLSVPYKILLKATDATAITTQATSNNTNTDIIKVIAGNTEKGIGGSAQTAVFVNEGDGDSMDPGTIVVTDDGRFFFADAERGLLTVDKDTGKLVVFIPDTGASTGDGGAAVNATLNNAIKITLDYQGRLLLFDDDRIRRIDLNQSEPTIDTIIGTGSDTSDTVANPLNVKIDNLPETDNYVDAMPFFAMPNGDIVFFSERAVTWASDGQLSRLRIYKAATGQVISKRYTGVGDYSYPTQDLTKCRVSHFGLSFNSNSEFVLSQALSYHNKSYAGCDQVDNAYRRVMFDPVTFSTITANSNSHTWWTRYPYTGMDGNLYILGYGGRVDRMDSNGTWTQVLGTGTRGECPDGTPATSCNINIRSFFVNKNGEMFIVDAGSIRVVDTNGNLKTILGQRKTYGDGVLAVNARFEVVREVTRLDNGDVVVVDGDGYYVKQFTPEGNINVVAGNGNLDRPNYTLPAAYNSAHIRSYMQIDRATGDLFFNEWSNDESIIRLNRSTGMYETVIGDTSGTNFETADGLAGLSVDANGNQNYGLVVGINSNEVLLSRMKYNNTESRQGTFRLKSYDRTDSYRQSNVLGFGEYPADGDVRKVCNAANSGPVSTSSCDAMYWDSYRSIDWDATNSRWILANAHDGTQQDVYAISGGNIERIAHVSNDIMDWYKFVHHGPGDEAIYYCNTSGRIRKYSLADDSDVQLTWPIANMTCRGYRADYNPTNNSLIFPFEQNGLYGVAEYYLP